MQFNSFTFLAFLAIVLTLHRLPFSWTMKKVNLTLASYVFYAAWNPPFVILLWISTLADWFIARRLAAQTAEHSRRLLLLASLGVNLGLLGIFKYGGFLLDNFTNLMTALGVDYQPAAPDIVLPVGISFYTFQTLSYTIDVYRGRTRPSKSFVDYAMYVTFFPQLVAGPIVRATEFLPQCVEPKQATRDQMGWGLMLLVLGLFLKIVVADGFLAPVTESVYDAAHAPDVLRAWVGTLAFAGQIYCDFAGYSTCAIGVALALGFVIRQNFRVPYAALGFSDFWGRWHISLSSWLRDYLYIPLGGNRRGFSRTQINLMLTMLIGGLWHGAAWTFVVWGGLHGLYLMGERVARAAMGPWPMWRSWGGRLAITAITFALVCLAWVFFRASTFDFAFSVVRALFGAGAGATSWRLNPAELVALATMFLLLCTHWNLRDIDLSAVVQRAPWWLRSAALAAMLMAIVTMPGEDRAFIYFQF